MISKYSVLYEIKMKVPTNPKPQFLVNLACFLVYIITGILAENEQQVIARCPSLDYVRCADGILCIHKRWMCDGRIDCSDHSDEDDAVCSKRPRQGNLDGSHRYVPRTAKCPKRWFSCMDGSKCVSPRYVCDRKNDCNDGSDEREFCHGWWELKVNATRIP